MLVNINKILLAKYKKLNILIFFIQPKNKHHLIVLTLYHKISDNISFTKFKYFTTFIKYFVE